MASNRFSGALLQTSRSDFSGTTAGGSERRLSYNNAASNGEKRVFDASLVHPSILQPVRPKRIEEIARNDSNFADTSNVDILEHSSAISGWILGSNCDQLEEVVKRTLAEEDVEDPRLLAFVIGLEACASSTYGYRASISKSIVDRIVDAFGCHDSFREDLVGRPDYWSAFANNQSTGGTVPTSDYEFYCQHSRWLQEIRWDKQQPRPPCSVYMHHSERLNLTVYLISAEPVDVCITQLEANLQQINNKPNPAIRTAAESPFFLHAMINGITFELSQAYVADIKNRLKREIGRVNDWAESSSSNIVDKDFVSRGQVIRLELESITKALHLISQNSDTGIANANMSIRVNEAMSEAHQKYAYEQFSPDDSRIAAALNQTTTSLHYLGKSWIAQKDWLVSYKARKDTSMSFVFNAVTQQDSATNVDIAIKMARDSSSMHTITILTMIFLPGTFIAGVFDCGIITSEKSSKYYVSGLFVPFICVVAFLTTATICLWLWRRQLHSTLRQSMLCVVGKRRRSSMGDLEKGQ